MQFVINSLEVVQRTCNWMQSVWDKAWSSETSYCQS